MIYPWHRSEQFLKFQISDLTLAKARVSVMACELGVDAQESSNQIPPTRPLEGDTVGYWLRGVPISEARPVIESRDGFLIYITRTYERYFINLDRSFDDYAGDFKAKSRSTIKRKVKKFTNHCGGEVDFRTYAEAGVMSEFYEMARQVSAKTYQEKLLDSGLPDDADYVTKLKDKAASGNVRGYVLFHDQKPISYLLLTACDGVLLYDYLGYDPEYSKWSIGTVLHWLALQNIFQEQSFKTLDFTEGEGQQKRQFGTDSVECANILCVKNSVKMNMLIRLHVAMQSISSGIGVAAKKLGLHAKIRKLIRGQN